MFETLLTGLALGLVGYLLLGLALGLPVSQWRAASLALFAAMAALGIALAWWVLPPSWLAPVRHLALGGMALWVGVRVAFPRDESELARGLRPWGWIMIALGVFEIAAVFF